MKQTTKSAEELAAQVQGLHTIDWSYEILAFDAKAGGKLIQSALTAEYERGKADVVPSGDAASLVEEYLSGFNYEDTEAAYKQYTKDSEKLTGMVLDITAAARAEGERIGFEKGKKTGALWACDEIDKLKSGTPGCIANYIRKIVDQAEKETMLAAAPSPAKPEDGE